MQARSLQKIATSDKYGATARINLNAISASKFKALETCTKFYLERCVLKFKCYGAEYGAPAPYQI